MGLIRRAGRPGKKRPVASAVILAAGASSRMGGIDKAAAPIAGKTVLERSVEAFAALPEIDELVVVVREDLMKFALELCARSGRGKVAAVAKGGSSRAESALIGAMRARRDADIILIHDAARPLVTAGLIKSAIDAASEFGAALPALPVRDTLKRARDGFIDSTVDRGGLYAAQTPQAFRAELIKAALSGAAESGAELTDDCAAVERLGMKPRIIPGAADNIKITTAEDLPIAEALLKARRRA